MSASLEKARGVKAKVMEIARRKATVVGVGLTKIKGSYAVKVNLREAAPISASLPNSLDGVDILYEVVGPIAARRAIN